MRQTVILLIAVHGNLEARAPSYELERILPFLETENLPIGVLGPQADNLEFKVEDNELPFSERYTWLITVGCSSGGCGGGSATLWGGSQSE